MRYTFGAFMLTSTGGLDIFVAKYDASGTVLWSRSAGGISNDHGFGIAVDVTGDSYVTGSYQGTATFGPFTLTSVGGRDIYVAKYDSSGSVLWVRSAGGPLASTGIGIAVDAAGNAYVTGNFCDTATFGSFTLTSVGPRDVFVVKYDTSGNVLWARSGGGITEDFGLGISVDITGNSFVTGAYTHTATFGSFTLPIVTSSTMFLVKYDAGGTVLWAESAGGGSNGRSTAVDAAGNSFVTGVFGDTTTFGSFTLTSAGAADIFVAKYDSNGNVLWARSGGGTSRDGGHAVAVDAAGNSFVTGLFQGTATFGSFTLTSAEFDDVFFVGKYDAGGNVLWAQSGGGTTGRRLGGSVGVDAAGNSYVAGIFQDTATFCPFVLTSAGSSDIFVAKYALFTECGNGNIDPCEQCDGGVGCTNCLCVTGFEPTGPPSLDCQPICSNGSIDPGEECDDGGESATCDADCTVAECGDGTHNVTAGEDCDGKDDAACAGACQADCTCPPDPLEACPNPWAPDPEGGKLNRTGCFKMPASAVAGGEETAIRVRMVDLYIDSIENLVNGCPVRTEGNDLSAFENQVRYLGPPSALDDNDVLVTPKFIAAELQCTPFYRNWTPVALAVEFPGADTSRIYYYGKEVFPCSIHDAQQATQACVESASENCFSDPLEIRTALWGDVWTPFGGPGQPTFTDIGKVVDAFKSIPFVEGPPPSGAPRKVRAMLRENSAPFDSAINFTDIGKVVDAFKTIAYPEDGPTACP